MNLGHLLIERARCSGRREGERLGPFVVTSDRPRPPAPETVRISSPVFVVVDDHAHLDPHDLPDELVDRVARIMDAELERRTVAAIRGVDLWRRSFAQPAIDAAAASVAYPSDPRPLWTRLLASTALVAPPASLWSFYP